MWVRNLAQKVAVCSLGAALGAACASTPPCANDASQALARQRALEAQVESLQAELASVRAALVSVQARGSAAAAQDEVDASFAEEPVDASWAPHAEATLRGLLEPYVARGTRIVRLECRSARCLLRAEHKSEAEKRALEQFMRGRPRGFAGTISWNDERAGALASMHYFLRAGARWPDTGASVR